MNSGRDPSSNDGAAGVPPPIASAAYHELPDAQLVVRTQRGDSRAFDELVRRYRDKVYRLAFKILRHEEDAAEALQDAFLSAFRGLKNFKAESTFSTWLYRITTNAALMKYRKRREGHVSLEQSQSRDDDLQPMELADWSQIPEDQLEDRETWEVLVQAVDQLPEDLKVVFFRRDWLEESNAEVADALSLSVAAVKSRLHRARIQLRDRLNRHFAGKIARRAKELSRRSEDE
ncbi:MAG TPA: sigma-70 family RNA polymerase sigma factor [Candidatus Sulfotelmatobacter sp.]|nr:sigma-70 family RNA polymerase sigma factor [Candidatus Sulfotelmatobacter sp.]